MFVSLCFLFKSILTRKKVKDTKRISPEKEIMYISNVIEKNIQYYNALKDKGFLAENILSQLRNLMEDVAILINNRENNQQLDTHYDNVKPSFDALKGKQKYKFILDFHEFLKGTSSHYTPSEDGAEKLVSYYFRYICLTKKFLYDEYSIEIIKNIDDFPIYDDKSMKENYDIICKVVEEESNSNLSYIKGKFYVYKINTIYSNGNIYYEITLTKATDYQNKFEHITLYSKKYIPDNYSINISVIDKEVELNIGKTRIKIINDYKVAIRVCELKNVFSFLGGNKKFGEDYKEYKNLMQYLTDNQNTITNILCLNDTDFLEVNQYLQNGAENHYITEMLEKMRSIVMNNEKGCNVIRYLTTVMENIVIRDQKSDNTNFVFDSLYIDYHSGMFDSMPFAMALYKHNISWQHLIKAIDMYDKDEELLYSYIMSQVENDNRLFVPISEITHFDNIPQLVESFNNRLLKLKKNAKNLLKIENGMLFIKPYEEDTIEIISLLGKYANINNQDLKNSIDLYTLFEAPNDISQDKNDILKNIFSTSSVAFIYGPAGTGKTKMIELLSNAFKDFKKCFIANTNTAVSNITSRVNNVGKSYFSTISSFIKSQNIECEILFIDECSMVSNTDMIKILKKQDYKAIVLVGDIYQIESIKYGNWFQLCHKYFDGKIIYNLEDTHRTSDEALMELWKSIRFNDKNAINILSNQEYTQPLSKDIFNKTSDDEVILCLNYDGMYGINNINRVKQQLNPNTEYNFGIDTYKIDDPILFNDCPRFNNFLYNNLKGIIKNIEKDEENNCIWFTIEVDEDAIDTLFKPYDVFLERSENVGKINICFKVNEFADKDDDENEYNHIIPFNLSYAISIHKAQGLEYDSVKIVITSNVEDRITKNIFYTAITRAKQKLKIYWSSDSQTRIFDNFDKRENTRDLAILSQKISRLDSN